MYLLQPAWIAASPAYNARMQGAALPDPSADALDASAALARGIVDELEVSGGWLRFDRWMARALYEPGLGYYAGGSRKFGADGDFVTAPELGRLFAVCVSHQLQTWFAQGVELRVTEFGAGSGALAAALLECLDAAGLPSVRYDIVELSGELAARQQATIAARIPQALARVRWRSAMPERLGGVVIGNEVLDAMPVRLFRLRAGQVLERGVVARPGPVFEFQDRPADPMFAEAVCAALGSAGWPAPDALPASMDYVSELGEQASAWVRTVAERLDRGVALLFDYGFPSAEFFHPQRAQGTLVCHYRHRVHDQPLIWPGLQDITAHVDFGAMAREAVAAGAQWLGYTSQGAFLLGSGLLDAMAFAPSADAAARARQSREVQQLVSEAEMGELFKVCAFARGIELRPGPGFERSDRSHRLFDEGQGA